MKEFSGEDPDAFLVDKAEEQATRQKEEREAALRVPGMVKPSDIQVDDEELLSRSPCLSRPSATFIPLAFLLSNVHLHLLCSRPRLPCFDFLSVSCLPFSLPERPFLLLSFYSHNDA
jgi:hypothetical protein